MDGKNIQKAVYMQQPNNILTHIDCLPLHLLVNILEYLSPETQESLAPTGNPKEPNFPLTSSSPFINLLQLSSLLTKYIKGSSRSLYFSFYSTPAFAKYEVEILARLSVDRPDKYFRIQKVICDILAGIRELLAQMNMGEEVAELVEKCLCDPDIPFPKMRKEGIGMHCNSSLQFALVDMYHNPDQQPQFMEDCIIQLQEQLESLPTPSTTPPQPVLLSLYHNPQQLTSTNYKSYLIPTLIPLNFYIYIHALLSTITELYHEYIGDQGKQFQKFVQYNTRYCVFRGVIAAMQEVGIARVVFRAMEAVLHAVHQGVIVEMLNLENKNSGENQESDDSAIIQNINRISSQPPPTQKPQSLTKLTSSLFLTGPKIWTTQSHRIHTTPHPPAPSSSSSFTSSFPSSFTSSPVHPSKLPTHFPSQQTSNNRIFIQLLNPLLHRNLVEKIQREIEEVGSAGKRGKIGVVRDQDIVNIFGGMGQNQEGQGDAEVESPTLSHHSSQSYGSTSPTNSVLYSSFNDMAMKNFANYNLSSAYLQALKSIQTKLRLQPYRFQKPTLHPTSPSPQKHHHHLHHTNPSSSSLSSSLHLHNLHHHHNHPYPTPSLPKKRLMSKASILSKITKITDTRTMGSMEELFQIDVTLQEQILVQYHAILIDFGVNQVTANWCGHSEQQMMGDYYSNFEQYVVRFIEGFMGYVTRVIDDAIGRADRELRERILIRVLDMMFDYLDTGIVAKKTLHKLCTSTKALLPPNSPELAFTTSLSQINKAIEHYNTHIYNIATNLPPEKLQIYSSRKFPKHVVQVIKCMEDGKDKGKGDVVEIRSKKRRRNSEQALSAFSREA